MLKLRYSLPLLALLAASAAHAQTAGTVTLSVNKTSAVGSLVPVLTWSTTPVASSCTASGGWSGTKFASGSETLAKITTSKSYTLTCRWGNGTATVSWAPPTTNTDGSALTNLAGFRILYGRSASALDQSTLVSDPKAKTKTFAGLASGAWYFAARAVTTTGAESDNSNVSSTTVTGASAAKTVNVTITGTATTLKSVSTYVYDVVSSGGVWALGRYVGTMPMGKPCDSSFKVRTDYYKINRADVTILTTPRSTNLVVRCALK